MNLAEHLAKLRASQADARKRMLVVAQKSVDEGRSMNDAEQQEFDTIKTEIETLDKDIGRFAQLVKMQADNAQPVGAEAAANADAAAVADTGKVYRVAAATPVLPKGIAFARMARVRALAETKQIGGSSDQAKIAARLYPDDKGLQDFLQMKAAVPALSGASATWGSNLVNEGGVPFADFVEWLRPLTLLGRVSPLLRTLPFNTPVLVQGSGGTAKWVKEGDAKPLTQWTYTRVKLASLKVAAIAAATKESLTGASIAADTLLRDELGRAVAATLDTTFIDPTVAAVTDTSPASILNGVSAISGLSDGSTIVKIRQDIVKFLKSFTDNNLPLVGAFWIMPQSIAINLSMVANEVGANAFPGLGPNGGLLAGLPVYPTNYAPLNSSGGAVVALVRGDEIFLGDEGGVQVSMSDQASLVMDGAPSMNATTPTAAEVVSLWQTNSVAFLVERFMNWQRRRADSVAWGYVDWTV